LRILPDVSQQTLAYVASLAEPELYQPSGQKTYKQIAREKYGVFNDKIATLMKQFNHLHSFDAVPSRTVYLPAGPRWSFEPEMMLPAGSNVSNELVLRSGYAGEKSLRLFMEKNPKWAKMLDRLPANVKLKLPFVAQLVSYRLKSDYASSRREIEKKLNGLQGIKDAMIMPPLRMTPSVAEAHLSSLPPEARPAAADRFWFYDRLFGKSRQIAIPRQNKVIVAVLDTGIPLERDDPRLYGPFLWKNEGEIPDNNYDDDNNGYVDDVHGVDMCPGQNLRGFPRDDNDNGDMYHGTHVAGLLAGILLPEELRKQVQDSLLLMILKVIDKNGEAHYGAITDAIFYATRPEQQANIVNMSFDMLEPHPLLEFLIRLRPTTLFVVAAGNDPLGGLNLDSAAIQIYPAQYSRDIPNLITVAAHGADGKLAPFSHWGEKTVDLAAPGVDVESLKPQGLQTGITQKLSGTSQATPLVSLAAALLCAAGVRDPADIRQRLITSAEYDPYLKGKVRSAGRLNIAKALAVLRGDVVQLKTGELICGTLLDRDPLQIQSLRSPLDFRQVRKIIFNYYSEEDPQKADLILSFNKKSTPDELDRFQETLEIFPLRVRQADGTVRSIERGEVQDLVLHRPVQ
jgi:hypothetical protein